MRRYLMYCENMDTRRRVGCIVETQPEWTSDDYGAIQDAFKRQHGSGEHRFVEMISLDEFDRYHGVYYDWGLAGPGGAWFTLIKTPDITAEQVKRAAREIRINRDCIRLHKLTIHKIVEFDVSPHLGNPPVDMYANS